MAYMNQEIKGRLAPQIKAVLKKYGMKGTLAVKHHSSLVLNIQKGKIDFGVDHVQVNPYYIESHFSGDAKDFLKEVKEAMSKENYDNSDLMTDYFDVGYYVNINIGRWEKPYEVI